LTWHDDAASVRLKLKVPATFHHCERAVCARWLAISQVWFLYGLPMYCSAVLFMHCLH